MKQQILLALPLLGAVSARMGKRQVPFEHAHRDINLAVTALLNLNNPDEIQDPVFGLLGAAAAATGAGKIADPDCLQQATADQAFTNAKEAGDVDGLVNALLFRTLERNTGSVGLESVPCLTIQAVNPEIAALQQHQDAAAEGAIELNKQIAAELARQIASVGGDPLRANEAATFAPGEIGDPTAAGNTCNDDQDDNGCINTLGLRIDDLTEAEILAAVADINANAGAGNATLVAGGKKAAGKKGQKGQKGQKAAQQAASVTQITQISSCNAAIVFGSTSDGRQQDAFEPADLSLFSHGSALNIGVISNFICSQISNRCNVGADIVSSCNSAASAAQGLAGLAAANAFNSALGL
ncbi:hypothetical protein B0J11DRAFT_84359 [Dendryphion nanum]|uniref:Uncharacterized protein n=1 Tax=Dendryphion nanum TaxID=256645 RepID=A0A9P9DH02_9PLEO|nr:hypothetical protein B0J11DRAFT_84359 [Dendryphion nanum]